MAFSPDGKWLVHGDGFRARLLDAVGILVGLREPRRMAGVAWCAPVGEQPIGAGERAEFVIERVVLVKYHEHIFHLLAQPADHLLA